MKQRECGRTAIPILQHCSPLRAVDDTIRALPRVDWSQTPIHRYNSTQMQHTKQWCFAGKSNILRGQRTLTLRDPQGVWGALGRVRLYRRIGQIFAAAGVIAAVVGCGGSSTPDGPGTVTLRFVQAAIDGDASAMCGLIADSELQKIKNLGVSCDAAMSEAASKLTSTQKQNGAHVKVQHVSIHGDHATVELSDGSEDGLVRQHGRWYVQTLA